MDNNQGNSGGQSFEPNPPATNEIAAQSGSHQEELYHMPHVPKTVVIQDTLTAFWFDEYGNLAMNPYEHMPIFFEVTDSELQELLALLQSEIDRRAWVARQLAEIPF
jgi:hypothetical protein